MAQLIFYHLNSDTSPTCRGGGPHNAAKRPDAVVGFLAFIGRNDVIHAAPP